MGNAWTLADLFGRRAAEHAERTLLVADGRSYSYGQVEQRAEAMAA